MEFIRLGLTKFTLAGIACFLLVSPGRAMANEATSSTTQLSQLTVFKQELGLHFPSNWRLVYSEQRGEMFSAEFVPQQQMLTNWSSLYCVQGFKGMAASISPEDFLNAFAENYRQTCQGDTQYQRLGAISVAGKQSFSAMLTCDKMPLTHRGESGEEIPVGEIGHYTVVAGAEDLFLLHQSARGEALLSLSALPKILPPLQRVADIGSLQ